MRDIQGLPDHRRINIRKVGIKNISYPVKVLDRARHSQRTVATVNMYVNLPHRFKGTHMSRFVEILNRFHGEINLASFHHILREMKEHLQAEAAHLEIEFPYFVSDEGPSLPEAPCAADSHDAADSQDATDSHDASDSQDSAVSHDAANSPYDPDPQTVTGRASAPPPRPGIGLNEYRCRMHGSLAARDELTLEIRIPIAPPRPPDHCGGLPRSLGHWGYADISLQFKRFIWLEEIIELAAAVTRHDICWPSAPAEPTAPLDEEEMQAGRKSVECSLSVENLARALGRKLREHPAIRSFTVRVENLAAGFNTFATVCSTENERLAENRNPAA